MNPIGVTWDDVLRVIASPQKVAASLPDVRNVWGFAANGVRIRVTYSMKSGLIITVAIADPRYPQ
jgi:hypothetical protein